MPVVVSDTSPIFALEHLGLLALLQALYAEVWLPPAVSRELGQPPIGLPKVDVSRIPFLHVQAPRDQSRVRHFLTSLHVGEAEALALASELGATVILIDELTGRAVARREGLRAIGTLGVLLEAKQRSLIPAVGPLMDRLVNEIRFFVSPSLRATVLRLAGNQQLLECSPNLLAAAALSIPSALPWHETCTYHLRGPRWVPRPERSASSRCRT